MRVSHHMKLGRTCGLRLRAAIVDQVAANTLAPIVRLHEECIQLAMAILARNYGRIALDGTATLGDEDMAAFNVFKWKLNGFWMGQERFTVCGIAE